jgi:hypothetical protein
MSNPNPQSDYKYTHMIDAIFIQSFEGEIKNSRINLFLNQLYDKLYNKNIKIVLFLNFQSIEIKNNLLLPPGSNIDIIYIEEDSAKNPTTRMFHFLLNHEVEKYQKILLLESDCSLKKDFDEELNSNLFKLNNDQWLIYGSKYYGLMPWMSGTEEESKLRRAHMNGVAIYNRDCTLLNLFNYIIISSDLEESMINYDFAIHQQLTRFNVEDRMIDSPLILNISDPNHDTKLTHHKLKPEAVIIHTKNPGYYNKDTNMF